MTKIGRYDLSEISLTRLRYALGARLSEIPHALAWRWQAYAEENRQQLRGFRDIHRGERCFIVANGPSLKMTDLELLENEISFGMNRIYLSFDSSNFRPTYFVAVNELILEQFAQEIMQLQMAKFLNWNRREYYDTNDPSVCFLKSRMVINDFFQEDITKPLVVGATVTFVTLQLAYFMGFQKVILVGLDHNYTDKGVPSKTEVRTAERDQSHFHPHYFPKGSKWQLPDLLRSEIDFALSRQAYESDGREIVDATIGGKCEIFKKEDYRAQFESNP